MDKMPESDWKLLAKLKPAALEQFCRRVLKEVCEIERDERRSQHERYGAVYKAIHARDEELAATFDGLSRSSAPLKFAFMRRQGLISNADFARFSAETRTFVQNVLAR